MFNDIQKKIFWMNNPVYFVEYLPFMIYSALEEQIDDDNNNSDNNNNNNSNDNNIALRCPCLQ